MAVLSRDFVQLIDNKGDPIVGATIYIGEGNRDPQLFPRLAYSNQARTNVLGSELISNDSGLIPKAYIEPPFSYRIRLRDGSQYEESLFSFGIVEIDYTPDGLGVDAINVGGRYQQVILEQDAISQSVQDLFGRVGVNTDNLAQEILNRTESIANETQLRVDAIQAAIDAAAAGDSTLKADLDQKFASVAASAESAQATANAGVSSSESALTLISESSEDIQALTLRADSSESEIQSNGSQILSVSEKTTATESRINDVFGDGSSFSLESFAADTSLTKAAIENSTTGLSATRDKVINTESRLNDVAGDASGKTVEQLAADYESLDSDVSQSAQASVEGFNQVNVRFGLIEDSLESTASQLNTVQAQANTANTTANAAISSAQAANVTANSASGAVSAIASDLNTVEINVNGIQNTVTQQATAINSIEGGVVNQWEVKSTIGDISGAIGLYNDGGSTKVAIDANAFEIWDTATNDTAPAFDFSGGQLSISVPTEIPNLSIGPEKLVAEATAQKIEVRTGSVSPPLNSFDEIFSDIISPTIIFVGAADDIFSQADPLRITVDEGFGSSVKLTVRIVVHQRPRFLWPGATPSSESVVCDTRMDLSIRTATTNGYRLAGSPVLSVMRVYSDSRADDVQTVDMDRNHRFVYEDVLYATMTTDRNIDIAASVYSRRTNHPFTPEYLNNTISSVDFFITIEKI